MTKVVTYAKNHRAAVGYLLFVAVLVFGLYRTENVANEAHEIARANSALIAQSNADRAAARAANCVARHGSAVGGYVLTNLIHTLLHQAIVPPPDTPPDQAAQAAQYLAGADAALSEANMNIAKGDCDPTTSTTSTTAPG